jgi:hypothetical protein
MVLLAVAAPPQMQVPPVPGSDQQDEDGEDGGDEEGKFETVLCREIARTHIQIEGEGQEQAGDQDESQRSQDRAAESHAEIWNPSVLRQHLSPLLFNRSAPSETAAF